MCKDESKDVCEECGCEIEPNAYSREIDLDLCISCADEFFADDGLD